DLPTLTPWYRGFEGAVTIIDRKKKEDKLKDDETEEILENDESDDEELQEKIIKERPLLSFVTSGVYHIKNNGTIIITALPIGRSPKKYLDKIIIEKMLEKKIIKKFVDR